MTEESDAPTTADAPTFMSFITLSTFPSLAASLCKLNLRNQGFVQVPAEVWACGQLTQLDIGGNPVTALEGIQALSKLRIFFATGCKLGPILPPDGPLAQLGSLTMLSIADNGLRVLDGAALPASLEWLIAKQNQLAEVRNAHRLCRVRKLGLAHNQVSLTVTVTVTVTLTLTLTRTLTRCPLAAAARPLPSRQSCSSRSPDPNPNRNPHPNRNRNPNPDPNPGQGERRADRQAGREPRL